MTLLALQKITRRFGTVKVLDGVDFAVEAGEIHALVGENGAGKSTLMRILCGALSPDSGEVNWRGEPVRLSSPRVAQGLGIAMIHQELALVAELSVAENICLGEPVAWWSPVDFRRIDATAREVLERLGQVIDPALPVRTLSLPQQQMVETARALRRRTRLLILDEPTAALTAQQTEQLFAVLRRIRAEGTAIIYISHRLEEVFTLCDRVSVLRDGRRVCTTPVGEITLSEIIHRMVGKQLDVAPPGTGSGTRTPILTVHQLAAGPLRNISFELCPGEIVGLMGLAGSGRSRLARVLFGAQPIEAGEITLAGNKIAPTSPRAAIKLGIGLLGEDRKRHSLIPERAVRENIALGSLSRRARWGIVHRRDEKRVCAQGIEQTRLKCRSQDVAIRALSGGNQQKALIARWLLAECQVLIFDEPTRGVDVQAKAEIYRLIRALAEQGTAILVISSELPELMQLSERMLILHGGQLVEQHQPYDARKILSRAMGLADL